MRKSIRGVACRAALVMMMAMAAAMAGATLNEEAVLEMPDHDPVPGGIEGALEDYSSPLVIPGASFRSDGGSLGEYRFWFSNGGVSAHEDDGTNPCMMAPVYIKPGVTITQFWVSAIDNDAGSDLNIQLRKVAHYSGTMTIVASVSSSGASASVQQLSDISLSDVTSASYTYYVNTCLQSTSTILLNSRVWYTE